MKNKVRKICELLFCFILIPSLYEDLEIIATSPYLCIAIYMKKNHVSNDYDEHKARTG
jgi:hypothetical protein